MSVFDKLINREDKLAVVGLGYVGLPLATEFSKYVDVIAFDVDAVKISMYQNGTDLTEEVGDDAIGSANVKWTSDEKDLAAAKFIIIAVPTPVHRDTTPDLSMLISASEIVGRNLAKNAIVVYESTVYPGVTQDICVPILEEMSQLVCGRDFAVGYSPERINPGDKFHRLCNITKIVSGINNQALDEIAAVYSIIIQAGVHKVSNIKVAEAAKVVENSQRDINIAFMNELSIMFDKMGIDTQEVLEAAKTKWNFVSCAPGLVGGHCIGVDPYYLTYCSEKYGYHPQIILSGRQINDSMGKYIAEQAVKMLIRAGKSVSAASVGCLGITFKENCRDIRNSKVYDIIAELREYGIEPMVSDPVANPAEVKKHYNIDLVSIKDFRNLDCLIIAVGHDAFRLLSDQDISDMFRNESNSSKVFIDVKGIRNKQNWSEYIYWRL
jgi:UDP-N-acetyl-D-galactosamine dehydrogenase